MVILDTTVISEMLRPRPEPRVAAWLAAQSGAEVHLTAITAAELRHGVALLAQGQRRSTLDAAIDAILTEDFRDRILPFDQSAARAYAEIATTRRAQGTPISHADAQIAAIARTREAPLATRNTSDFIHCGLTLIDPWAE